MKKQLLSLAMLGLLSNGLKAQTTLFKQDFNSSTDISDYNITPPTGSIPERDKFTALLVGAPAFATLTIQNNKLHMVRLGGKSSMGFTKNGMSTNPGFVKYSMEFAMSGNSAVSTNLIAFSAGTGYTTAVQLPQLAIIHSLFYISPTATNGTFTVTAGANSATFAGTQNITFFVNNTGGAVTYKSLSDGNTDITLDNDKSDLWVGTTRIGTAGVPSDYPGNALSDFRLSFINTDLNVLTVDVDNIEVTELQEVLPVSLLSFNAEKQNDAVLLKWSTASEKNNSHFDILRSTDGKNFDKIAQVDGAVNSSDVKEYNFKDVFANGGTNYYQLKQIDLNGDSKIYGPVAVKFGINDLATALTINSKDNSVDVMVTNVSKTQSIKVSLYNINGSLLSERKANFPAGSSQISIPVAIPTGVHIINVEGEDFYLSKKFIKNL